MSTFEQAKNLSAHILASIPNAMPSITTPSNGVFNVNVLLVDGMGNQLFNIILHGDCVPDKGVSVINGALSAI